jgi:hypothetical protein
MSTDPIGASADEVPHADSHQSEATEGDRYVSNVQYLLHNLPPPFMLEPTMPTPDAQAM